MLRTFGEHIFNRYVEIKRQEWEDYRVQVTQWELDRYLAVLVAARGSGTTCRRRARWSIEDAQRRGPPDPRARCRSTSAGTRIERTTRVSSSTPKATTKPISVRNTSGSTASTGERAGEHDAGGGDHPAGDRQAAQHALAGAVLRRLLAHARHQEDVVVDPQRHQEDEGEQGQVGSAAREAEDHVEDRSPTPRAAANDRTTVAISISGATSARSSSIRTTKTTSSASGTITLVVVLAGLAHVVLHRGRPADERVRRRRPRARRRGPAGSVSYAAGVVGVALERWR